MAIVLENAYLADFDPIRVEPGALRIEHNLIVQRGGGVSREVSDEVVDCAGALVLPGLVNGHTHLYAALGVGMRPVSPPPKSFVEILQAGAWRLDQAHDAESITTSARIGALDALRCGTTTLFDHHSSPNCVAGSLDLVEGALAEVGLRGILCYETTDRHGPDGRAQGLEESRRYLEKRMQAYSPRFAGVVGAHASFTLEDETLEQLAWLAADFDTGVHMHVAEDVADEEDCQEKYQTFLIDRLAGHKLLKSESVFVHGTHFDAEAISRVREAGATLVHCPRSNMNNGVGTVPMAAYNCPVMLGSDGFASDLFAEAQAAWLVARQDQANLPPAAVLVRFAQAARRASKALQTTVGKLERDAAADVVITDYRPATPLTTDNLAAHFLFALRANHVVSVIVDGEWRLRDRSVLSRNEARDRVAAIDVAQSLWQRVSAIELP